MKVQGHNLIGDRFEEGEGGTFRARDARTGEPFGPAVNDASKDQVRRACLRAAEAFSEFRSVAPHDRADALDAVADALNANQDVIVEMADRETALGSARLRGELGRTSGQWRLFAELVRDGSWAEASPATMLHDGIRESYRRGVQLRSRLPGVATLTREDRESDAPDVEVAFFRCDAPTFASSVPLHEELFGPAGILVVHRDDTEMLEVARGFEGQLTATIHAAPGELEERGELVEVLLDRVGRLLFGGFPTGVRVGSAMHHGGPYPATTDARFTSVGSAAIERFVRPGCYQNAPEAVLPPEPRDANPLGISRMVDGRRERSE